MGKLTRFAPALLLIIAGTSLGASPSRAGPITYTGQATGSGCLGATKMGSVITCLAGDSFTNALVTITMTNLTTNVVSPTPGLFENFGTTIVNVSGLGSGEFTDSIGVFSNQNLNPAVGGFADFTAMLDILDTSNNSFVSYNLKSAMGPISGSPVLTSANQFFPTSVGGFVWSGVPDIATFTATTAVPEPPGYLVFPVLLACGGILVGIEVLQRKRQRSSLST
jgi:hypothetical protein